MLVLTAWAAVIILPFLNVVMVSFTTNAEYVARPLLLIPRYPTLNNYAELIRDGRIWIGYRTTLQLLIMAVPLNLFLTTSFAYGLSRKFPGRKLIFYFALFTMLFNGGIIPMYMLMLNLGLIGSLWSVVLASGMNTFYMILMRNFFARMPEEITDSAKIDGAGEWTILFRIILPLSAPIIATITLFYTVDRWNEWFNQLVFVRAPALQALQLVLRSIVLDSMLMQPDGLFAVDREFFGTGIKMATIMATMLPVMFVFPFLQKHFAKGIMLGGIKA